MNMNSDIERTIIGEMFLEPSAYYQALPVLRDNGGALFSEDPLRLIYEAIEKVSAAGRVIDITTVSGHMRTQGTLDHIGGTAFLAELLNEAVTAAYIEDHARLLVEHYQTRKLRLIGDKLVKAIDSGSTAGDIADGIIQEIQGLKDLKVTSSIRHVSEVVTDAQERYEQAKENTRVFGIKTGFTEFDELTGGLQPSDLIILAGRPSNGKSTVAVSFIMNAAKVGTSVLFFSAEMTGLQIVQRMIGATAGIDDRKIKRAKLNGYEETRMIRACEGVGGLHIYIDDTAAKTIADIESDSRKMVREQGVGLVVVDYLQRIKSPQQRTRHEEVAEVSTRLKNIAKEHGVPVLALAQLNRAVEGRTGVPQLSDLRDSGQIEQEADVVAFLHSFERAREKEIPEGFGPYSGMDSRNIIACIVEKQRTGPTADLFAYFDKATGRISSIELQKSNGHLEPAGTQPF